MKQCGCGNKAIGYIPRDMAIIYIYCENCGIIAELAHTIDNKTACITRVGYPPIPINKCPRNLLDNFKGKRGRRPKKKYFYDYAILSKLTGLSQVNLRQLRHKGIFDINNLESVVKFIISHNKVLVEKFLNGKDIDITADQERRKQLKAAIARAKNIKIEC
jgi:hypothetical protein